jgi:phage terminase large subunit-like protein
MDAVNNTIEQLPKIHAELKSLLTQLKVLIEKSQLKDEDKNVALAYVRNITEIYQHPP